jgi:hypothetical protein
MGREREGFWSRARPTSTILAAGQPGNKWVFGPINPPLIAASAAAGQEVCPDWSGPGYLIARPALKRTAHRRFSKVTVKLADRLR